MRFPNGANFEQCEIVSLQRNQAVRGLFVIGVEVFECWKYISVWAAHNSTTEKNVYTNESMAEKKKEKKNI